MHNFEVKKGYIFSQKPATDYNDSSAILVGAPQLAPGYTSEKP